MTVNELIRTLQALPEAQRERSVWMEADAGYAKVYEIDTDEYPGEDPVTIIIPEPNVKFRP